QATGEEMTSDLAGDSTDNETHLLPAASFTSRKMTGIEDTRKMIGIEDTPYGVYLLLGKNSHLDKRQLLPGQMIICSINWTYRTHRKMITEFAKTRLKISESSPEWISVELLLKASKLHKGFTPYILFCFLPSLPGIKGLLTPTFKVSLSTSTNPIYKYPHRSCLV
ncbi:hypothetical protein STEG23_032720, partial [Scotinomys teguina]